MQFQSKTTHKVMKPEIIILSDLWGKRKSEWVEYYEQILSKNYEVKFYDSCDLGLIDTSRYDDKFIHSQFVEFGIKNGAKRLLEIETQPKIYIGCSVGGAIIWQAALKGLPIEKLITVSATRIRTEVKKPECPMKLYFGEDDPYRPLDEWYEALGIHDFFVLKGHHDIYKKLSTIKQILRSLHAENWI